MTEQPHAARAGTVSIRDLAIRLGIGRNLAYDLARTDRLPVPVIRLGRRMVVASAALDAVLGRCDAPAAEDAMPRVER